MLFRSVKGPVADIAEANGEADRGRESAGAAVRMAAREHAVPVVQSAMAIAALVAPAALAGTQTGLEFLHPLAVTILGGLVSLVIVQVLVLPAFLAFTSPRSRDSAPLASHVPAPRDGTRTPEVPGLRPPPVTGSS